MEDFDKQLKSRNMTVADLKTQLRKDLSIQKLLNKEIASRINITDGDVKNFYNANRKGFNFAEPQFHMMQIVVTRGPDPAVRNLKNDKAQNDEQARKKIEYYTWEDAAIETMRVYKNLQATGKAHE